jgi:hypothetical protein
LVLFFTSVIDTFEVPQAKSGNHSLQQVTHFAHNANLPEVWKRLVVRVMSARNHDFGSSFANSFYNQDVSFALLTHSAVYCFLLLSF